MCGDKKTDSVGLSWLDMSTGSFYYSKTTLSSFLNEISSFSPKEIILTEDLHFNPDISKPLKDYYITVRQENKKPLQLLMEHFKDLDSTTMTPQEVFSHHF